MPTTPRSILACAAVCAGVAGCGSSGPSVTTGSHAAGANDPTAAAFAFSRCMHTHGETNFPDPQVSTSAGQTSIRIAVPADKGSPQFRAAFQACRHLIPGPQNLTPAQRHARVQAMFAFARCLRSHGVSKFPDPNGQGQLTLEMITTAGVDLHAPGVLTAGKACVGVTHGQITVADVERAVNGPPPDSTTAGPTSAP